eukprot:contig_1997_g339
MHMDSCPSTNKSQFFYGGIGLMLASGLLDCAMVVYMVVGHTKFGPDLVARQIAGRYNVEDAFNHRQLVNLIRPYATAGAYDDTLLQTWKRGTQALFMPIVHIMSYRCFLLLADDGDVCLGDPVVCPDDFEPYADSEGLFLDADLMRECNRATERQLCTVVFPDLRRKRYRGVGERAVSGLSEAPSDARLLPASVSTCRKVRLFTRRCVEDKYWREQSGWMRDDSLAGVNAALAAVRPYPSYKDLCKDAYGAKAKDIADQYAKYVPPEFVPDRFELPTRGCTGTSNVWKQTTLSSRASTEATARSTQAVHAREGQPADASAGQALKKVRWSSAVHTKPLAQALMARPFNKTLPKNLSEWVALAGKMPAPGEGEQWDVMTLKRHAKATLKSSSGVTH